MATSRGTRRRALNVTAYQRLIAQVDANMVAIGADAARKIAKRIEDQGGFWGPRKVEVKL